MNSGQKIIKLLATMFAIFLAVSIIGGILGGIFLALRVTDGTSRLTNRTKAYMEENSVSTYDFTQSYTGIESLDIDVSINNLKILSGDEFTVTMKNVSTNCTAQVNHNVLEIVDANKGGRSFVSWFVDWLEGGTPFQIGTITVTIPEDVLLEELNIDSGTGTLILEDFQTKNLEVDAGTGTISLKNVKADYLDLDSGTGTVSCKNVILQGSDINTGTGTISIQGELSGNHIIDCGVGTLHMKLNYSMENYSLNLEKGLGSIILDGKPYSNYISQSFSGNSLTVNGGVGNINIDFSEPF